MVGKPQYCYCQIFLTRGRHTGATQLIACLFSSVTISFVPLCTPWTVREGVSLDKSLCDERTRWKVYPNSAHQSFLTTMIGASEQLVSSRRSPQVEINVGNQNMMVHMKASVSRACFLWKPECSVSPHQLVWVSTGNTCLNPFLFDGLFHRLKPTPQWY